MPTRRCQRLRTVRFSCGIHARRFNSAYRNHFRIDGGLRRRAARRRRRADEYVYARARCWISAMRVDGMGACVQGRKMGDDAICRASEHCASARVQRFGIRNRQTQMKCFCDDRAGANAWCSKAKCIPAALPADQSTSRRGCCVATRHTRFCGSCCRAPSSESLKIQMACCLAVAVKAALSAIFAGRALIRFLLPDELHVIRFLSHRNMKFCIFIDFRARRAA